MRARAGRMKDCCRAPALPLFSFVQEAEQVAVIVCPESWRRGRVMPRRDILMDVGIRKELPVGGQQDPICAVGSLAFVAHAFDPERLHVLFRTGQDQIAYDGAEIEIPVGYVHSQDAILF